MINVKTYIVIDKQSSVLLSSSWLDYKMGFWGFLRALTKIVRIEQ
ncbi:hypothetical protein THOE12_270008 [Vibrio rotiferianus]|nr:hypothetical protein THOE12_270008 [Vibrio rotiferianus]